MPAKSLSPTLPLPRSWTSRVKSAILQVISLAQFTMAYTRGWAANSPNSRIRLKADLDRAHQEIALLREELRIHHVRMAQLPPHRRPYYPPAERMAILQLRAARSWSLEQTAKAFLVTAETIASWLKRVDEQGPDALVQLPVPVNRYPEFVRYVVQQLKSLCPMLGKMKIAQILARAGLHLGVATVGRILKEEPQLSATGQRWRYGQQESGGHREVSEPLMAHRLDGSPHRAGLLDDLAPVYLTALLALCLVACPGRGSFLPSGDGLRRIPQGTIINRSV